MESFRISSLFDDRKSISLSKDDFYVFVDYSQYIGNKFAIEEKFCLVIDSYYRFSKLIFEVALRSKIYGPSTIREKRGISELTSSVQAILASISMYVDSAKSHFKECLTSVDFFEGARRIMHENNFSYRLMYNLRNHTLHRSFPFSGVSVLNSNGDGVYYSYAEILIDSKELGANHSLNAKFLNELEGVADREIKFNENIISCMKCLSRFHLDITEEMNDCFEKERWILFMLEGIRCTSSADQIYELYKDDQLIKTISLRTLIESCELHKMVQRFHDCFDVLIASHKF